jgi:hypothetical protein
MDLAPHNMAVRFYSGKLNMTMDITQAGKEYHLLSLPYYLVFQIEKYVSRFEGQIKN